MRNHPVPTTSITQALLDLPSIGSLGVERSIVFTQLPPHTKEAILAAPDEAAKRALAIEVGDTLDVIAHMYEHYIAAPARRREQGAAFPTLGTLQDFPLPGVLHAQDRAWLRVGTPIARFLLKPCIGGWEVEVRYSDGQERAAGLHPNEEEAKKRLREVQQAAFILGLYPHQA